LAKNLKINVKNSQLSQVLKGIRQKKDVSDEAASVDHESTKTVDKSIDKPVVETESPTPKKVAAKKTTRAKKPAGVEGDSSESTSTASSSETAPKPKRARPVKEEPAKEDRPAPALDKISKLEKSIFKDDFSIENSKEEALASFAKPRAQEAQQPVSKSFETLERPHTTERSPHTERPTTPYTERPARSEHPARSAAHADRPARSEHSARPPRSEHSARPPRSEHSSRTSFSPGQTQRTGFQPKSISFDRPTSFSNDTKTQSNSSFQERTKVSGRAEPRQAPSDFSSTERRSVYRAEDSKPSETLGNERRSYPPREGSERSERPPYTPRDPNAPRNYPPREGGERRPHTPREGNERGERPPYTPRDPNAPRNYPPREGGERRPYTPRDPNAPRNYPPRDPNAPPRTYQPREGGERRPYTPRDPNAPRNYPPRDPNAPPRTYQPREGGERRPYTPRDPNAPRTYQPRDGGERRPYTPRDPNAPRTYPPRDGTSRPYSPRPTFGAGQRPPFGQGGGAFPAAGETTNRRSVAPKPKPGLSRDDEKKKRTLNGPSKSFDSRDRHGLRDADEGFQRRRYSSKSHRSQQQEEVMRPKAIAVALPISVKDLASEMKLKAGELIARLLGQGIKCMLNDLLDDEVVIQLLGADFGCDITIDTTKKDRMDITDKSVIEEIALTDPSKLITRPPVVTFMGHVDHGKTSLIDALRNSNLASKEAGAITQHIGAFSCHTPNGDITVLDTPGHEAFTTIRSRGASVTDIVVLVVAGDEGFKMQTEEAVRIAKEAKLPMIFALNKMDKEGFDPEKVYRQMADHELLPEAWGGTVPTVNCSALTGAGISELMELLGLQSEVLELKADPHCRARGTVLESEIVKGLGPSATLLIQNGTLRLSDALVFGEVYARVKTMQDEFGKSLKTAGPSHAVRVTGLSDIPSSGSEFIVVKSEKEARKICEQRSAESTKTRLRKQSFNLGSMLQQNAARHEKKIFNVIVKADVQGSLEAIKDSLMKIKTDKVLIQFVAEGLGMITLTDAEMAMTSHAVIFGFHTKTDKSIENFTRTHKIQIHLHDVIYHLVDDARAMMTQLLDKTRLETEMAEVEVRAIFRASHLGVIAGCMVTSGTVKRSHIAKVFRNGEIIFEGDISSLKRVKEDVKEVSKGHECGILLKGYDLVEVGDVIKTYEVTYIAQEL